MITRLTLPLQCLREKRTRKQYTRFVGNYMYFVRKISGRSEGPVN